MDNYEHKIDKEAQPLSRLGEYAVPSQMAGMWLCQVLQDYTMFKIGCA
jgi:hypothetical protein